MKQILPGVLIIIALLTGCTGEPPITQSANTSAQSQIELPLPRLQGAISLEEALQSRRSIREYSPDSLTLAEVAQLLWAAQGVTAKWGGRTAPSAGGLYPLEIYLASSNVENLESGVYLYNPQDHGLTIIKKADVRKQLTKASLDQKWVNEAAINIVIAAVSQRTTSKYGERGIRYVHMEAGHAAQNVYLQATALGLGTVTIGAFHDEQVKEVMAMADDASPLYVMPVGRSP